MNITYENKQQIIKHESGHRDIYTKKDLIDTKNSFQEQVDKLSDQVKQIDSQILELDKT
jgi:hypothetical protein